MCRSVGSHLAVSGYVMKQTLIFRPDPVRCQGVGGELEVRGADYDPIFGESSFGR